MTRYQPLLQALAGEAALRPWLEILPEQCRQALAPESHGDLPRWQALVDSLPPLPGAIAELDSDTVRASLPGGCGEARQNAIEQALRQLHPWRKGPYGIHGVFIDTEWRSDWKWRRLAGHIAPLAGRLVLDVGCGNGYHCWRMLGAGARRVIGIDPTLLSVMQFQAVKHFLGELPVDVLPLGIDDVPKDLQAFDTVFSMGVLYHRRSPLDHLLELKGCLKPGGELVLETLVIAGGPGQTLLPEDRYAKMRNVWFIPSCATLESWLQRCGYRRIRCVDVTPTSTGEQRSTGWMRFHSLADFLAPNDPRRTAEGLPAPIRAVFLAEKP